MAEVEVRSMGEGDLETVIPIMESAFGEMIASNTGRRPEGPRFSSVLGSYRFALDPDGCHVAVRGSDLVGANFSVLRGTIGWFGPLAVRPEAQGLGIAQLLVTEFIDSATRRGARLMGLETIATSSQHIHLYQKLGFLPSWTGISFVGQVRDQRMPDDVVVDGVVPSLDYVLEGFSAARDVAATRSQEVGAAFTLGEGLAICHVTNTLGSNPDSAYVPLIVAPDRRTFDALLTACEAAAREGGKSEMFIEVPGSSRHTLEAVVERGYRPRSAALRMKRGENLDYESRDFYYCDDWH